MISTYPPIEFINSVILFFSSMNSVWYFLVFSMSVEILTLFMHCSPDLSKHLYDH